MFKKIPAEGETHCVVWNYADDTLTHLGYGHGKQMNLRFHIPLALWGLAAFPCVLTRVPLAQSLSGEAKAERLFALKVKPLIAEKCLACHGADPEEVEAGLELTSREGMIAGGYFSGQALVPGKAAESLIYKAVIWADDKLQMPAKDNDRLTEEQTWWIRDWINGGAPWPDDDRIAEIVAEHEDHQGDGITVKTSGGLSDAWDNRRYNPADLWAYQPLRNPPVPQVGESGPNNPIDAFIDARLDGLGIRAAPPADRRTLIRRVSFDLTGLPPSPAEVEAFVGSPSTDEAAFAQLVERLLESPHYGEHWGRHWLDVVRYADSSGYANDFERGNAWRYRDYVVRSFNNDKPYDAFVREQIAGDEIDPNDPEMLIAAGFLRMGPWELTSMEVPKIARQRFLDDVTDSVGQVFLSHPLQCASCHDHKFDPIPTRDYYSLQAVFATTQLVERKADFLQAENTQGFEERESREQRRRENLAETRRLSELSIAGARQWYAEQGLDSARFEAELVKLDARKAKNPGQISGSRYTQARRALMRGETPEEEIPPRFPGYGAKDFGMSRIATKNLQRLRWEMDRYEPFALSVYSGGARPVKSVMAPVRMPDGESKFAEREQTAILVGGDPFSPGSNVSPGALSVLNELTGALEGADFGDGSEVGGRRTALANWIVNPNNALAARSIVNRVWQWHFGRPLAGNPNNFGAMGKRPTHPELLDWLAVTFIEQGWSFKELHRVILSSRAYQRSAQHPGGDGALENDPDGTSYAVFEPRRLTAEELRDGMLRASGELNAEEGGIPVRPEINREVALQPRMVMGTFAPAWQPSPRPEQRHRRSIYSLKLRGLRDPFMEVFNEPGPDASCEAREAPSVTPQVFTLINGRYVYTRALALAARVLSETDDRKAAIQRAFQLTYGRPASEAEIRDCDAHWLRMESRHENLEFAPPQYPGEVIREAVDENTGEPFSYIEKLHAYDEFVPDLQPSDADAKTRALADLCLVLLNSNEYIYVY